MVSCSVAYRERGKASSKLVHEATLPARLALRRVKRFVLPPVAALWLLEAADQLLFAAPGLDVYGIRPRTMTGLRNIVFAPWLHGTFAHLAANTLPLVVFAALIATRGARDLLRVSVGVVLLGGLGVWLLGAPGTVHIGASGVVFGYFGYLLTIGWFERRVLWVLVSIAIALLYGGLALGVLPGTVGVSWESHLAGAAAGIVMARWAGREARPARRRT